jgi:hypothetical protein
MDFRFAQLEGRLTHHRRWLEKETESHIQDFAEIEHQRKKYLRFLQRQHVDTESSKETEEEKISKRLRRVEMALKRFAAGAYWQEYSNGRLGLVQLVLRPTEVSQMEEQEVRAKPSK